MSLELGLRKAVYEVLQGDAALTALVGNRVFDHVPDGAGYPRVVIGEAVAVDDTYNDGQWLEVNLDVHVWSDVPGTVECLRIIAAARAAIHGATLTMDQSVAVGAIHHIQHVSTRTIRGRDPNVSHGITTFRAHLGGE